MLAIWILVTRRYGPISVNLRQITAPSEDRGIEARTGA